MAKIWDDMKKNLKTFSSTAMEKAEEFSKVASDKAEELTKVGKLNWEIKQLKRTKEKHLITLGNLVYSAVKANKLKELVNEPEVAEVVGELKTVEADIKSRQDRIDKVHAEFGIPLDMDDEAKEPVADEGPGEAKPAKKAKTSKKSDKSDKTE